MLKYLTFFLFGCFAVNALYQQCPGVEFPDLEEHVIVTGCEEPACKLKKSTTVGVEMKFKTDREVSEVFNNITANIAGANLPFIGFHGENACSKIYEADGTTPAGCPLKANTDYVYKLDIYVLPIYPSVSVKVHWALSTKEGDLICFEVPAKITKK